MAAPAQKAPTCFLAQTTAVRLKPPRVVPGLKGVSPSVAPARIGREEAVRKIEEPAIGPSAGLGGEKEGRKEGRKCGPSETIYGYWKQCCRRPTKGALPFHPSTLCQPNPRSRDGVSRLWPPANFALTLSPLGQGRVTCRASAR